MEPARKLHPGITALIVIVLIAIATTAVIVIHNNSTKKGDMTNSTSTTQTTPLDTTGSDSATNNYKDGTYNATGSYLSPAGQQSIELTVTIKDGVITNTSLVTDATDSDAKEYQSEFASAYKSFVVGKKVDEVKLSRVSGSSLTSNGFNSALDHIKSDAKA